MSVEGCEEIGRGANGTIYRIDMDNVVKVYNNADALEEIQHEREVARTDLVLGIPTAISYDVVRVGESYGSVFELLNARSFSKILATEPEKMDWCVKEYVELLKKIHGTEVPEGELPDIRETVISWGEFMQDYLPEEAGKKLLAMIKAVPEDHHMIHGDYHTKNVELTDSEVLLIDMDTLAVGHPVFELASMFNAYIGYSELDPSIILKFQGFDHETAKTFWEKTLALYLGTEDPEKIRSVEDKARIVGYTRMIRRSIRRGGLTEKRRSRTGLRSSWSCSRGRIPWYFSLLSSRRRRTAPSSRPSRSLWTDTWRRPAAPPVRRCRSAWRWRRSSSISPATPMEKDQAGSGSASKPSGITR